MKATIFSFKRCEIKYILAPEQYEAFMKRAGGHFVPDEYHESHVYSIYYDDGNYSLIRQSIDKPVYKEKIRLRSYGIPAPDGTVFVELKKKFDGIVYKRRVEMTDMQAEKWLAGEADAPYDSQITREIDWILKRNRVLPKVFVGTQRTSWVDREDPELRVTFDRDVRWRKDRLSLTEGADGEILLKDGRILMEIKIPAAAPLWLASLLSEEKIYPSSYSKYGACYTEELLKHSFPAGSAR